MTRAGLAALLLLASAGDDGIDKQPAPPRAPVVRGFTIRQQIIIRVPAGVHTVSPAAASLIRWEEHRGPRCVTASRIVGATLLGESSVDLIFRDNTRIRARLERRCPALDYYMGFYVNATQDGQICADRDAIRARAGGECQIDRFRTLTMARDR